MHKTALYYHGGSKNHGCEAIVRATLKLLEGRKIKLFSFSTPEDKLFNLDKEVDTIQLGPVLTHEQVRLHGVKKLMPKALLKTLRKVKQKLVTPKSPDFENTYKALLQDDSDVFVSIGGDNYCYGYYAGLTFLNKRLTDMGKKTVLWGCSVEPKDIHQNAALREDLKRYSLITARESLTFNALMNAGITQNTHLCPDPAFMLEASPAPKTEDFELGNTVGINLSPLVQNLEKGGNITYKNVVSLIEYILHNTDMNIALIPHVVWDMNNDKEPLAAIYNAFKQTGRLYFFDGDYTASELKGIIGACRFMVAARTHASIAAYSSMVPTMVIGYSVKARGIAQDIFGTWQNYVVPVQDLRKEEDLTRSFKFILMNEQQIKMRYKEFMPQYIEKARIGAQQEAKLA